MWDMIRYLFPLLLVLMLRPELKAQQLNHFISGERLKFIIYYGPITGGTMVSEVQEKEFEGKRLYYARMLAKTAGLADKLYKVRDEYISYFDPTTILPYKSIRNISEGRYKKYDHVYYYNSEYFVKNNDDKTFPVPSDIRDILAAVYFIRNIDFTGMKKGEIFRINTFFDNELFPFDIRYMGNEKVKIKLGEYSCIKLVPYVETGRVFENEDDVTIYLSNDANRVPIRVEFILKIGSVKVDLIEYSGLKY